MNSDQVAAEAPNLTTEKNNSRVPKTDMPRGVRHLSVRSISLRSFVCVAPDTTVEETLRRMTKAETDAIFVCDESQQVVGVFAHRDVLANVAANEKVFSLDLQKAISEVMTPDFARLDHTATLAQVVQVLNEDDKRYIAITDGDKFIGAISDLDIVTYLAETYSKETLNLPPVAHQMMDTREGE